MANEFILRKGLISLGGTTYPYKAVTTTYAIGVDDQMIDCTSGTFSVTLPTAVGIAGKIYIVKNTGSGTITVNTTSSQTIDGSLTKSLKTYESLYVESTGTNWIIVVVSSTTSGGSGGGTSSFYIEGTTNYSYDTTSNIYRTGTIRIGTASVDTYDRFLVSSTTGNVSLVVDNYGSVYNRSRGITNTLFGFQALSTNTSGQYNTAVAWNSLFSNTTGYYNTAIGIQSLYSNTTGSYSTAVGSGSLYNNTTGNQNTAVGFSTLYYNTTGYNNTGNGYASLYTNTTGYLNTSNGWASLYTNTTGYLNTAVGGVALYSNTTGFANTANGYASLYSNTTGQYNTGNGYATLYSNTTGQFNIAIGNNSMYYNTTGGSNTAIGVSSLTSNTNGQYNIAIGNVSLSDNTIGYQNTAVGYSSLSSNTTGYYNTTVGYSSLASNTTGIDNVAIGHNALFTHSSGVQIDTAGFTPGSGYVDGTYDNVQLIWLSGSTTFTTTPLVYIDVYLGEVTYVEIAYNNYGSGFIDTTTIFTVNNIDLGGIGGGFQISAISLVSGDGTIAVGRNALYSNTTGGYNTAIGYWSLYSNTIGGYNTAIGYLSLYSNTTGDGNIALGNSSLYSNIYGSLNVALGYNSLYSNTGGYSNNALGFNSLYHNTTGSYNTAIGYWSLFSNTIGGFNTAIGYRSLYSNTSGVYNIAIGHQSLFSNTSTGNYNIALGFNSLYSNTIGYENTALGNYSLYLNTTGYGSIAIGEKSLQYSTTQDRNTAVGYTTMKYYKGLWSVGLGGSALSSASTGIVTLSATFSPGSGYTPGTYSDVRLFWSSGTFWSAPNNTANEYPTATIVVGSGGTVSSVTLKRRGVLLTSTTTRFTVYSGPNSYNLGPSGGSGFSIGIASLGTADLNTALGFGALANLGVGSDNIGIGMWAGFWYGASNSDVTQADQSIFIGRFTNPLSNNTVNEIVIGNQALGNGPNSITLGNDLATKTILKGNVGIGLTGPSTNLHIYSTSSAFRLQDGSQGAGKVLVSDANGLATWSSVGSGSSGSSGTSGIAGNDSSNSGRWLLNSTSSGSNPGPTKFNTNSSSVASITTIVISSTSITGVGDDYISWLSSIESIVASGNSAVIQLVEVGSNNIIGLYNITSVTTSILGGYYSIFTVSYLAGAGTLTTSRNYTISWNYSGKPLPVGSELAYAELYSSAGFSTALGTGTGLKPWVTISNASFILGDNSSDVSYNSSDTLTISSKTNTVFYEFIATIGCFKSDATSNGIDIGVAIDGVDPVVGMYTSVPTAGFSSTQREMSISGIFSLSPGSSHTVQLRVRQTGGGNAATNTFAISTINFNIRSINAIVSGSSGTSGSSGSSGSSGTRGTSGSSGSSGTSGTSGNVVYRFGSGPISPSNINTYYIGTLTDLSATSTNFTYRQSISQFTGYVTEVSILRWPSGLAGTGESSTFNMINVTQGTTQQISNAVTTNSGNGLINNYVLGTPLAVTTGDFLQITWVTPTWVTPPTSVRILAHVKITY